MHPKQYISDVVSIFTEFPEIKYIHVLPEEASTTAVSLATDRSVMIKCVSPKVDGLQVNALLGNLSFLEQILKTEQLKTGDVAFVEGTNSTQERLITGIDFTAPRMSVEYTAADPRVADVSVPGLQALQWNGEAKLETVHLKDFRGASALMLSVNKGKKDFKLEKRDNSLFFVFSLGAGSRDVSVEVADITGEIPDNFSLLVDRFEPALNLIAKAGSGSISFANNAVRIELKIGDHEITVFEPRSKLPG